MVRRLGNQSLCSCISKAACWIFKEVDTQRGALAQSDPSRADAGGIGGGRQGAARDAAPCGAGDRSAAGLAHAALAVFGVNACGVCGVRPALHRARDVSGRVGWGNRAGARRGGYERSISSAELGVFLSEVREILSLYPGSRGAVFCG